MSPRPPTRIDRYNLAVKIPTRWREPIEEAAYLADMDRAEWLRHLIREGLEEAGTFPSPTKRIPRWARERMKEAPDTPRGRQRSPRHPGSKEGAGYPTPEAAVRASHSPRCRETTPLPLPDRGDPEA